MFRFIDPEEPQTKEYDPDYTEELGDDLPAGATCNTSGVTTWLSP
jgi:hypothetical protein